MAIGKSSRTGGIGRRSKVRGKFGKGSGTQGSAYAPDTDYPPVFYPSTTSTSSTSSTISTTSSSSSTSSTISTTSSSSSTSSTISTTTTTV